MQLRNVQRESAEATRAIVTSTGLRTATVVGVDEASRVQLDVTTDPETGLGVWYPCLNHGTPQVGEHAIYTYVHESLVVLGTIPTEESTPWRIPRSGLPDTFFVDDFEVGNSAAGGWPGTAKWTWSLSSGSSFVITAGTPENPGWLQLGANNVLDGFAWVRLLSVNQMPLASITEAEFLVRTPAIITGTLLDVALTDADNHTNAMLCRYDTAVAGYFPNWAILRQVAAGGSNAGDTGIPVKVSTWYKVNFKQPTRGTWVITVTDLTDILNPVVGDPVTVTGFPDVNGTPYLRCYQRAATGTKFFVGDYFWWARRGLRRGGVG